MYLSTFFGVVITCIVIFAIRCIILVYNGCTWREFIDKQHATICTGVFAISTLVTTLIAFIVIAIGTNMATGDVEYINGYVTSAKHTPNWVEWYEKAIYRTEYYYENESYRDDKGRYKTRSVRKSKEVFDHWEARIRNHDDEYDCTVFYGINSSSFSINENRYKDILTKFGGNKSKEPGKRYCGRSYKIIRTAKKPGRFFSQSG